MNDHRKHLEPVGLVLGLLAVVLALASLQYSVNDTHPMHPESAIAVAIVAGVFVYAGRRQPESK